MGTFNPEVFPEELMNKIATAIATTPLPLMLETLVIHFIYEIMREAGLRLPKPLGHAVSIVGALVIGDTAISSGLIGATTLMVVALTAISSYVIPTLYEPIAILRLLFILVGGILGLWGVMLLLSMVIVSICGKTTYGVPFSAPVSPFSLFSMRDVAVRSNWKILSNGANTVQHMPRGQPNGPRGGRRKTMTNTKFNTITAGQLFCMLFITRMVVNITYSPFMAASDAMLDQTVSCCLSIVLIVLIAVPIYCLHRRWPNDNLVDQAGIMTGRFLGALITAFYGLYFLYVCSYNLSFTAPLLPMSWRQNFPRPS